MSPIIRHMRPEEVALLPDFLYLAIFVPEGVEAPDPSILALPELQIYTKDFGASPHDQALVVEVASQVVGMAWVRMMQDYGHVNDQTPSLSIAILPDYRGQGLGRQLLASLFEDLATKGYEAVSLSVQVANPAYKLYQTLGFDIVKDNGDEVVMLKSLSSH